MNAYEKLYNNMKTRFTVVNENSECTLGEYMLAKAGKKKESTTLPIASATLRQPSAVVSFVNYINDKLMVKEAPQKDKVMRAFPFRTSMAAALSAVVACALIFSYGIFTVNGLGNVPSTIDAGEETSESEIYDAEIEKN